MRVIVAAFLVIGAMFGTVGIIDAQYPHAPWPWWSKPAVVLALFGSLALSMFLLSKRGLRSNFPRKTLAVQIADLDAHGLIDRQSFRAVRAFAVEEFEDEGSHYYLELADGGVLYVNGQYLYDYEQCTDDPELNQPRTFPCTEFEVLRHKEEGFVFDMHCGGIVLEPEVTAPPYTKTDWKRGVPEDGQVIKDRTYEALKFERAWKPFMPSADAVE